LRGGEAAEAIRHAVRTGLLHTSQGSVLAMTMVRGSSG
jgi:hypothetical protein